MFKVKRIAPLDAALFCPVEKARRSAQIWHAVFTILNSLQSAVMLFIVTRLLGESQAGVFSLSFSVAYLMIMVGNYGVRNYHATDVRIRYGFKEYRLHRWATCALMVLGSVLYVLIRRYDAEKAWIVLLCCLLKLIESVENVYHSEYQRAGRLDVAGKIGTIRFAVGLITFIGVLIASGSLLAAFVAMDVVSIFALSVLLAYTYPMIQIARAPQNSDWKMLFIHCFPLFLASFSNIFISNASKYALDIYATEAIQGYYGLIYMPVFVINLISGCIYGPFLVQLASDWNNGHIHALKRFVWMQFALIGLLCAGATVFGYFWGIKLLSLIFGTDLSAYRGTLTILLVGGGMTALVEFTNNIIAVIRKQKALIWIYAMIALFALIVTVLLVKNHGITGAAISYTLVLSVQAAVMIVYTLLMIKRGNNIPSQAQENASN